MTMKRMHTITRFAALAFVAAGPLFAVAASAEDKMKPESSQTETMGQDAMKSDGMKTDRMKADTMKSDGMKSDHMGDDTMRGTPK
jgi:pentapeptide MXKDX repeat protein